jgi:acetate kinase
MRVLAVNLGSSSLRLSIVDEADRVSAEAHVDSDADPAATLRDFSGQAAGDFDAVAHRLVHGGPSVRSATLVDDAVRARLDQAATMAPLHVPAALRLLDAARETIDRPQVVCVDTAFHAAMPEHATTYAVPSEWRRWGVRRYGFHGLSYAWSSRRCAELLERPADGLQMVIAHIGAGVSACAVRDGRSVDTSMGFTPLEGAVMAMRSGSVDPGALLWLQQVHGITTGDMNTALEHRSGLLALSGRVDLREIERGAAEGDTACAAALDVYIHSLSRVIGGLATSLDRLDVVVFTGGVGEHSTLVRTRVCRRLALLGVPSALADATGDAVIARAGGGPAVAVVTAREDAEMARETRRILGA